MKTVYKGISCILQPFLLPTFGILMLISMSIFAAAPFVWKMVAVIGTFAFTGILPLVPILLMIKKGEAKNVFLSKREERTTPYLFSFMAYLFWGFFLYRTLRMPFFMASVGFGSAISILIVLLINLKWKISAHLSAIGGLTAAVYAICFRFGLNPFGLIVLMFALSALLAIARIELKEHTPGQALAGFLLGFICVITPCLLF